MRATVNRIVHYVNRGSADGVFTPRCTAAIITDNETDVGRVGLIAFNPTGLYFQPMGIGGCERDDGSNTAEWSCDGKHHRPGSWHWAEVTK